MSAAKSSAEKDQALREAVLRFCDEADASAGAISPTVHAFVSTQQIRDLVLAGADQ